MKALLKMAPGAHQLGVRDVAEPVPEAGEVVVRVAECGVCGTDVSLYEGSATTADEGGRATFPMVIGHEFTGTVVARGAGASSLDEGDWVVVNPHLFCGVCRHCLGGEHEICDHRPLISWDRPGGAAEYVAVREANAYRLPASTAARAGALAEPLAVAVHALRRLDPDASERVAVVGPGPIGILLGLAALDAGLAPVVLGLPVDAERLAAAARLGLATEVLAPGELEGARGRYDVVFEAAGADDALSASLALVRKGGRVAALGLPHHPVPLDLSQLVMAEKSIVGVRGYAPRDWERTVELLARRADDLSPLITHRFGLEQVEEAMATVENRRAVKVVLQPAGAWYEEPSFGSKQSFQDPI